MPRVDTGDGEYGADGGESDGPDNAEDDGEESRDDGEEGRDNGEEGRDDGEDAEEDAEEDDTLLYSSSSFRLSLFGFALLVTERVSITGLVR